MQTRTSYALLQVLQKKECSSFAIQAKINLAFAIKFTLSKQRGLIYMLVGVHKLYWILREKKQKLRTDPRPGFFS